MISMDVPDWQRGVNIFDNPVLVSDSPDWNKTVLAYELGDPRILKDKPDWTKGVVKGGGSKICTYETTNKLLLLDLTNPSLEIDEYIPITLTATEAKLCGIEIIAALTVDPGGFTFARYIYGRDELDNDIISEILQTYGNDAPYYLDLIAANTETRCYALDYYASWWGATLDIGAGDHLLHIWSEAPGWSKPGALLRLKLYLLYDIAEIFGYAVAKLKGEGGITW